MLRWRREEKRREREEAGCNLTASLGTGTKKLCVSDKWVIY